MRSWKWYFLDENWLRQYLEQTGHWPLSFTDLPLGLQAAEALSDGEWLALLVEWRRTHPVEQPETDTASLRDLCRLLGQACREVEKLWDDDGETTVELEAPLLH